MKSKKLNLFAFKQEELSRENISLVKAGAPIDGKPPGASSGGGSGGDDGACYIDIFGDLKCPEDDDLPPVVVTTI
jgi:hypothetical protein